MNRSYYTYHPSYLSIPYSYRYGFNGQEREQQLNQSVTSAEYWFYDGRLGRRWNVDPVLYPWNGGYTCFNSIPILYADPNGDQPPLNTKSSVTTGSGYNLQVTPAIDGTSSIDLKQDYQIQQKLPTDMEKAMKNNTGQDVIKEGWAGYDDYLITKARVETAYEISKYAPYTGDVHDACSVIYHIGNGNYKGAVKSAVFFIPFADFAKAFKPIFKLNKPITKALANEYEVLAKTHNISDINITDIGTGKFAVIGQSMDRVKASAEFFSKTGSEIKTFHASDAAQAQWKKTLEKYKGKMIPNDVVKSTKLYQENVTWINKMKNEGYGFIDIGEDIGAKIKSTFYNMEKGQVYGKSKK